MKKPGLQAVLASWFFVVFGVAMRLEMDRK